jgi:glycosyltransferase involved in cell wall biosynthesis
LNPIATVIVTAYNRRSFILDAVRSALNQTAHRDKYEIIVVKNYFDEVIDKFLSTNNVIQVYSTKENLVTFTLDGLLIAKGELIIFLEDDDRFLPTKIEQVILRFMHKSNLVYLHNSFQEIDETGEIRKRRILKQANEEILISTDNMKLRSNRNLFQYFAFYNTSCISVRRELYMQLFLKFPDLMITPTDLNFYILSLLSEHEIMFTNAVLNQYRVHAESRTFGRVEITHSLKEQIEKDRMLYLRLATKYATTFGFPLLMLQALELTFQVYILYSGEYKPSFRELLAYTYYSFKRKNRFFLALVMMRYFNFISDKTLVRLNSKRKSIRLNRD